MIATITNLIKEHDRIRVFVSFDDGTDQTFLHGPEVTKDVIVSTIKEVMREKRRTEENATDLATQLINRVIEI